MSHFVKILKNLPVPSFSPGYIFDDHVLDVCQKESVRVICRSIEFEEENYLSEHPEVCAMITNFFAKELREFSKHGDLKALAEFFTRPIEEIDKEIRQRLELPAYGPYYSGKSKFEVDPKAMMLDLWNIYEKYHKVETPMGGDDEDRREATKSSSFISLVTSGSTVSTPEITPERSPTTSEVFYGILCKLVDKATTTGLEDYEILYDAAYVEVMNAVENAMEMTVVEIKQDVIALLNTAYRLFNAIIIERERITAEENWEKRMRKKLKRTLRRIDNFKGYETPSTPKSFVSSHESYRRPPPMPCECNPQYNYNRYPKDRFGIYLPRQEKYRNCNITLTPSVSMTNVSESKSENQKPPNVKFEPPETASKSIASESDKNKADELKEGESDTTGNDKPQSSEIKADLTEVINQEMRTFSRTIGYTYEELRKARHAVRMSKLSASDNENDDIYTKRLKMLTFIKKKDLPPPAPKPEPEKKPVQNKSTFELPQSITCTHIKFYNNEEENEVKSGAPRSLPVLPGHGFMYSDSEALNGFQTQCLKPLITTMQIENTAYLVQHPEIEAMLAMFLSKVISRKDRPGNRLKYAIDYFTRAPPEIEFDIRTFLKLSADEPYAKVNREVFQRYNDQLLEELLEIARVPVVSEDVSEEESYHPTTSSEFISRVTSASTIRTPEPPAPPELTFSETLRNIILCSLDKAIYSKLQEDQIYYDIAYGFVTEVVDAAMEIAVKDIKCDISKLFGRSYHGFEVLIKEKERRANEHAWEMRMRKKWKKLFRLQKKFKGLFVEHVQRLTDAYFSFLGLYALNLQCIKWLSSSCEFSLTILGTTTFDNFGTYLDQKTQFSNKTITITPDPSHDSLSEMMSAMGSSTTITEEENVNSASNHGSKEIDLLFNIFD